MVWFGSTIFSTNKPSMKLSKYLIKSLLLVTAFGEKGLQKFVRSYPWVTLSKSKSTTVTCYIHQEGLCTHITLFYGNHVKLGKVCKFKTTNISPVIYLLKLVIKTCFSWLFVTVYCKKSTDLWIFTKCINYLHRKHLRRKQHRIERNHLMSP